MVKRDEEVLIAAARGCLGDIIKEYRLRLELERPVDQLSVSLGAYDSICKRLTDPEILRIIGVPTC